MSLLATLFASIVLNAAHPVEKIDLGPACEGGYPTFEVKDFAGKPTVRISYATHPDGLGERGDFWRETAARYLGEDIDLPILPANIDRYEFFSVDRKGMFRAKLLQGLVRYVRIALEKPADGVTVTIDGFRLDNDKVHSAGERQGSFTCSDDRLNRVWEASVRTCELSAIPSYVAKHVTPAVTTLPYLADGAKRDRLVWSGDLWWAERNMFYGFRTDEPYMRGSIRLLAANRTPEGYVQACPWPEQKPPKGEEYGPFPSDEFAAWFIPVLWDYHLYRDDRPLLAETWTLTRDLVNYLKRHVRADGIFEQRRETSKHAAGLVFGGTSCHHRSYMNILLWFTYVDAAKIAAELGHAAEAETWRKDAEKLAPAVRANFWDAEKGHFVLSMEERKIGQEANALALSSGFATAEEAKRIMPQIVRIGHGKFQAIAARGKFMYGDAKGALAAIEAHGWYKLVDPSWPGAHLTSECTGLIRKGWGDEAHPDTAIAGVLSAFVLGVEPLEPGYRKFRFDPPAACGIDHASGRIPTPHGEIVASWRRGADGKIVTNLTCPAGTECVGRPRPMPTGGICAHRGDRAEYPENTVPAFKAAVEKGAAMVEFDVHRCKTGELIVMHDSTIDRTTTGKGRWCDLTFEELRAADAGVKRGERFRGVKIPTFDEAIDCFPKDGVWLNVHCDDSVTDEVARKIQEKGRLHQAFIAAGAAGVARARAVVPEIKVCLFASPRDSWSHSWTAEERRASIAAVIAAKAEFTQPHNADFTQDELYDYHARGGKVNYFWCNKPSRLPALLARGIDFPLADNLAEMVKAYNACLKRPWAPADPEHPFQYLKDGNVRYGALAPVDWVHDRKHRVFGGIPSIACSPKNGRLWRTWYGGPTDGEDSNNYVILATSADDGTTWREVLVFDPDGDGPKRAFDPQVWVDPNGRLQWTWTERVTVLRDGPDNRWGMPYQAQGERLMAVTLDAENEPAAPYPTPRTLAPCGVMMMKPTVTRDGRWLYPLAVWFDDFSARVYESRDGGETLVPVGAATVPRKNREYEEHNIVELKDGTIRLYLRVAKDAGWNAWQCDSRDGGRTWDAPKRCPFPHTNSRFWVTRLRSGALLLVKNGSLDGDVGRVDMTAFVSDDDGETWKGGLLLKKGSCSYPDGCQAPDGTIYVTFDDDRYGKQSLHLRKFTEADVRAGSSAD